jgi:UDP-N-acetylglucosamine enolpyruvyl transferase
MRRILDPLERMGTTVVEQAEGGRVPLTLRGPAETIPIRYETPAASAQIKSAVLLAGLNSPGRTTVIEREATRDHTERMLRHFGAEISVEPHGAEGRAITLQGQPTLRGAPVVGARRPVLRRLSPRRGASGPGLGGGDRGGDDEPAPLRLLDRSAPWAPTSSV